MDTASSPPKTKYQIRPYHPEAMADVLALARQTLGNTGLVSKTDEFWHWKHHANPFGMSYGVYAWVEEAQLVAGLRIMLRWKYSAPDGQQFQAVRAVDTATHPDYQRQGIFSKLTNTAISDLTDEGVHFIFNTPNSQSLPGYLKMGWQIVTKWPLFVRLLRPVRMAWRKVSKGDLPSPTQFEAYFKPPIITWQAFVERYGSQIAELVAMHEAHRPQVGLRTTRSCDYLQWRYGQHPHLTYAVYPFEVHNKLVGFVVLRPNTRYGWQEVVINEMFLTASDYGKLMLQAMYRALKNDYLIAHFAEGTLERMLLKQTGFITVPRQGLTFTVRQLNTTSVPTTKASSWDLTLGDLELF